MKTNLLGKKILFFGIGFYDYETEIEKKLQEFGAQITYYIDQPKWQQIALLRRIATLVNIDTKTSQLKYQQHILNEINDYEFDYVFIIKGENLQEWFIKLLREKLKKATFILYQWDSLNRVSNAEKIISYFDKVFSFDRLDCLQYKKLTFRPLFYRHNQKSKIHNTNSYDLTFIGWLHADRLPALLAIEKKCRANNINVYFYLYTGLSTYLKMYFLGNSDFLYIKKLSFQKVIDILHQSKCILDLPHPLQTGLTIRTIESLGMGKKLITTNTDVFNYDFFNDSNIMIIKDFDIQKMIDFIKTPYTNPTEEIMTQYSLDSWITDIFKETTE